MKIVKLARSRDVSVFEFEDMRETWEYLFGAFRKRLNVLKEIWRQQRMDVGNHVNAYAGGLFARWDERVSSSMGFKSFHQRLNLTISG
jgi:hypothetical protein